MTQQTPDPLGTAIEQALAAAGREVAASFAEAGYRLTATTALGQVIAGLPGAAIGMVAAMPAPSRYQLAEHTLALHEIAVDQTPEGAAARGYRRSENPLAAKHLTAANVYLYALAGRDMAVARHLGQTEHEQLVEMRAAAVRLIAALDLHLPQDQS